MQFDTGKEQKSNGGAPKRRKSRSNGLPEGLRSGVERLSGMDMSDVRVHRNSAKPAQVGALGYAQGSDIHLGPGQEKHLPHEAWHVVQQKQGRVQATKQMKGVAVNDNQGLEKEADQMGARASRMQADAEGAQELNQKTVGNNNPVQRLVGFEAEIWAPSMPAPSAGTDNLQDLSNVEENGEKGGRPTPAIAGFLKGGLPYGKSTALGDMGAEFQLVGDHNDIGAKHNGVRRVLTKAGYSIPDKVRSMSNLEYVTEAKDELAPGSDQEFKKQIDSIAKHAGSIFDGGVREQMFRIGAPAAGAYTGVPVEDFVNWLGPKKYKKVLEPQLRNYYDEGITERFYLQATVGILPSAIRKLHDNHTPYFQFIADANKKLNVFYARKVIKELEGIKWFRNDEYVKGLGPGNTNSYFWDTKTPAPSAGYESFMGALYLAFIYMIGNALNQTNWLTSTMKNAVPFLSKTRNMKDVITKAAPELAANRPPDELVQKISDFFNKQDYVKTKWWIDNTDFGAAPSPPPGKANPRGEIIKGEFLKNLLSGNDVTAMNTGGDRTFDDPDDLTDEVSLASDNQRGAQFEYRGIDTFRGRSGLKGEMMKVVKEVRELNLKHMDPARKKEIKEAAEK